MSDIHIHIDRETPVKVITLEPNGARGAAATVSVGTTTTGNAGTNASVTNSGTTSAAVFNFTIPRGDTGAAGAAGPNSVTSATTSDGTAQLSVLAIQAEQLTVGLNNAYSASFFAAEDEVYMSFTVNSTTMLIAPPAALTATRSITFPDASGTIALTSQTVLKSDYTPAHSILAQQSGTGSPTAVTLGNNTILGRMSGGGSNIAGLSASDARTVMGLGTLATVNGGTGVADFLASPTSANLAAAVTGETGSGSLVFGTSPTLTTPAISGIMALSYSNNAFANGFTVRNTSTGTNSLSGITVQDSGGTNVGYMQYCPSNFTNVGLQNTVIFGSIGTQRVGFVANAGGNVGQDVYFKNHSQQTSATIFCQGSTFNVGIGTDTPNAKALLDVTSTTKGFLPPRMTTAQRDAITSVPAGLMIYNTTTNKLNVYTTAWEQVTSA